MFKKLLSRSVLFAWLSLLMSEIMVGPALGQRPGRQGSDDPPELHAVWHGVQGIDAFVKAGEKFIGQKNEYGQTAAMLAAIRGLPEIVEAFLKAGGKFTEAKDKSGRTAAMYIVNLNSGPGSVDFTKPVDYDARCRVIEIFSRVGGRFTDDRDVYGRTAAMDAVSNPKVIAAFVKAGGRFTNQQDSSGYTAAMGAVMYEAENVRAFARAGGKFTSQSNAVGQTAEDIPAGRGSDPLTPNRGRSVLDAYREAVRAQGGLIYISTDDEFTALRNPRAIESFVKSGKHFDNGPDKDGMTAAMLAIGKGPKTLEAFIAFGGKFTTQQNKNGETAAKIASNYNSTRYPGILDVYDEAVRKQGGLVSVTPVDEYEAVRMGPPGIDGFIKAGKFTDHPNRDDLTSAMIAAARSPEVITAFAKAGGRFTDTQNKLGYTAAMVAVLNGPDATKAFARAGGHFTEQQDHHGRTAGMLCASRQDDYFPPAAMELKLTPRLMKGGLVNEGGAAIQAFAEAGGRFTDQQDSLGRTAAMQAVFNGPEAIRAFAKAGGGQFTEKDDGSVGTAAFWAASMGAQTITAFLQAGGRFTNRPRSDGMTAAMVVARGDADAITAFSKGVGVFTDQKTKDGWTAAKLAGDRIGWKLRNGKNAKSAEERAEAAALDRLLIEVRGDEMRARDIAASKAYAEAIVRQGGLRHVQ